MGAQIKNALAVSVVIAAVILAFTVMSGLYFIRSIVVPLGQVERTAASIAAPLDMPAKIASRAMIRRAMAIARSPVPVATSRMRPGFARRTSPTTRRRHTRSMLIESVWFSRSYFGAMLSNISRTSSFLV